MCMCIYIYVYISSTPRNSWPLLSYLVQNRTHRVKQRGGPHFCGRATVVNRHVLPEIRPSVSGNCLKRPFRFRPWRFGRELPVKNSQFFLLVKLVKNKIRTFQDCFSKCSSLLLASKPTIVPSNWLQIQCSKGDRSPTMDSKASRCWKKWCHLTVCLVKLSDYNHSTYGFHL